MATNRRARSAERPGPRGLHEPEMLGRLRDILEQMWVTPRPEARHLFKAPQYAGVGDVEYFVRQFEDVAAANQWAPEATFLHLRAALRDEARDCGRPETVLRIYAVLDTGCLPGRPELGSAV